MVPRKFQNSGSFRDATVHNRYQFRIQIFGDELSQQRANVRTRFRWLYNNGISSSDSTSLMNKN